VPDPHATDALVHFSGGSDSTLCAAMLAEAHPRVHLMTYDRLSFIGAKNYTRQNYERLCRVYGPDKFVRRVVHVGALHKRICYDGYLGNVFRFGLAVSSLAFAKLSMHWFSAAYALHNGIQVVTDGAAPYMDMYPDQNEAIALRPLQTFYQELGIAYSNPIFGIADEVEQRLYDRGITLQASVRGTETDKQIFYVEQVVLALFVKYYMTAYSKEKYVEVMGKLFANRLDVMRGSIEEFRRDPERSQLGKMVRKAMTS
jgi:hypothetical protein